jgi:predicted aspartyl protease
VPVTEGARVSIAPSCARWMLVTSLVLIAVFEGCSTTTSELDSRRTAFWAAAAECARGHPGLKVEDIDAAGQVRVSVPQRDQQAFSAFTACYKQRAAESIAAAERVASPARIVESSGRVTSVPMQTKNNRFLVGVVLNERQAATFLLDTGASITVITPELAHRTGIEIPAAGLQSKVRMASGQEVQVSVIRLGSIRIGLARIDNLGVALYELGVMNSPTQPPLAVDGLLGADVLSRFIATIDPDARKLTLKLRDMPVR